MGFAADITRRPLAYDPGATDQIADRWASAPAEVRDVLLGTAGSSPYLAGLMLREADWLDTVLPEDPATVLPSLLRPLAEVPLKDLSRALRQAKRRAALYIALCDLAGVWEVAEVTQALTNLADAACDAAAKALVGAEIARGKLPGLGPEDIATAGGLTILAMGKMGAGELNYSSDIDLISLFDENRFDPADFLDARAAFIRVTRRLAQMLGERTAEGYVFRTDLRLRPDPGVTPVCVSMGMAERYYESFGRTWERAAHIKARPCAGDQAAGEAYLERLRPFIWRRHLDFAAIEEAQAMRQSIRDHKGLWGKGLEDRDIKLAPGGIREIEFFTQTLQLISGGRDPSLRVRGTVEGLARLAEGGWVQAGAATELTQAYAAHRRVEHALQMVADAQTHSLPREPAGFDRIARLLGEGDTDRFRHTLEARIARVADLAEGFFVPGVPRPDAAPELTEHPIVARWPNYAALRSPRAFAIFDRLKPELLHRLETAPKPEEALTAFDGFLSGLPAGVQLFSLFEANPDLLALIVDVVATAPALAQYLSRNAGVLDGVLGGSFFAPWPGREGLGAGLLAALFDASDYEAKLDAARAWTKEWHFRVGVHLLRGLIDSETAGRQYADLAEAVVAILLPIVGEEVSRRHGPPPGKGAMVLAMGALGAGWMTATSDLDLIVIYDPDGVESSDGPRPLAAGPYYAKLTQTLVTALSAPMAQGRLYEVDMRLRPSGRQGPVATALRAFDRYQREDAWTWEHLALTRARPIAGPTGLCTEVETIRQNVLALPSDPGQIRKDVAQMRTRLAQAKRPTGALDAKLGPGRMQDIDLLGQTAALAAGTPARATAEQLDNAVRLGWMTPQECTTTTDTHRLLRALQATGRLLGDPGSPGTAGAALITRETGTQSLDDLSAQINQRTQTVAHLLERVLNDGT